MEGAGGCSEVEREREENDSEAKLLRDRFRLSAISIAESEGSISIPFSFNFLSFDEIGMFLILVYYAAKKTGMELSKVVVACVADLAFKYTGTIVILLLFIFTVAFIAVVRWLRKLSKF